ncbi:FAD:protein FMN transferase [Leadbettera azotonutricia]|uniref:FAD:protein FMN transferase n=1 Tax=Leadbettera azotonutricia (strain ATCC BAA-888 / DSM 13862 / ZAS-9) TaxID=545695 RepID=F5YBT7_LEAAZ|nr:FAD:protein FMN transferase [Leadbettera azotonutricia]AEF83160.1 ApbE family protein [Leadbettera azotonutricia ZAS-9]
MRKNRFSLLYVIFAGVLAAALMGCSKPIPTRVEFALGTVCSISLYEKGNVRVYQDIFGRLAEIEKRMSVGLADSDISRINAAAGIEPVKVHADVFEVVERAMYYAEISGGAFDPTVEPLVSLWGIGGDAPRVPSQGEIDAAISLINWRDIVLDREQGTIFLKHPGMALDLGAIAKGYAADEVEEIVKKAKIPRALIDLGGNILTYGEKADHSPWRVGIQNPNGLRGSYIGIIQFRNKTMVTSGVYERFFEENGVHYHHILSTADGYPVRNGLLSVSIITDRSMDADGLSTSVFALGYERGRALVESLEGVQAVFVFEDMSIRLTKGTDFILTDDAYQLVSD